MFISPRQLQILQAIVQSYIGSGVPVGSRTIARHYSLGVSPATVRNEMSDLEEMGFLEQPHTSAGRVPSDSGYRLYVDTLLPDVKPDSSEIARIESEIDQRIMEKEQLIVNIAQVLSDITSYTAIVSGPYVNACALREFTLVPVNEKTVVAIIATDNGITKSKILHLPKAMLAEDIGFINRVLNESLKGKCLRDIHKGVIEHLMWAISEHINREDIVLKTFINQILQIHTEPIIADGIINVLNQPEFKIGDKYLHLLEALNARDILFELLSTDNHNTIKVDIGKEITNEKMRECSIVKIPYFIDNRVAGVIGVLGPKRMTYAKVIALLGYVSQRIEDILQE